MHNRLSQSKEDNIKDAVKKMLCEVSLQALGEAFPQGTDQVEPERSIDDFGSTVERVKRAG